MTITVSKAELEAGFTAATDLIAAVRTGMITKAAIEQVASDGFAFTEDVFPEYAPALVALNFLADLYIQYNTQGEPGSQTPMFGGPVSSRIPPP